MSDEFSEFYSRQAMRYTKKIDELQSKIETQQELVKDLIEVAKTISERLNEHSRVAIHKDSIVHVRMKRAIAKLEEK